MPLNTGLAASNRIEMLDNLLRHDRWWSREQLLTEMNKRVELLRERKISEATLRNDLFEISAKAGEHLLEETHERNKKYYRYDSRNYSVYNIELLLPEEYDSLHQAIGLLQQIRGFAVAHYLETIIAKLKYSIPAANQPMVVFDSPEHFSGMELMQQVYDAITLKQVIYFDYQSFTSNKAEGFTVHPYLLKEYNNRWFLVGYVIPQNKIWTFPLDRFSSDPRPRTSIAFIPQEKTGFDPDTYFSEVIGPTVDKNCPAETVLLKFNAHRAPYILTKPLHKSQLLEKKYKNGSVIISLRLRYNKELLSTILQFGADVEVLSPLHLQQKVADAAFNILNLYKD